MELAPDCRIVPIRIFEEKLETSPASLMAAIDWAASAGLKVLNLSLGTIRTDVLRDLYATCARARSAGVVLVAAARSVNDEWSYPAVLEPVIGVGLADLPGRFLIQFRPGAAIECATSVTQRPIIGRDLVKAAPGFGASYAAPIVTALVARWLEENPYIDTDGVRAMLGTR
jgi:subtilisin family serine protease